MFKRSRKVTAFFKKIASHAVSFFSGVITLWGFSISASNAVPTVNLESIVTSDDRMSVIFENKNSSSLDNFYAEFYVYLDGKTVHIPRQEMHALVGSGGRRVIDLPFYEGRPDRIVACVSYDGAYFTDTVWQKVELYSPYDDPMLAMNGIFTFTGETTKLGHNYFFNANCGVEA